MEDYMLAEYGENLIKYFEMLRSVGGTKGMDPYRFLIIGYIDEIFNSEMADFITECDYKAIDRLLNCWMGTCLMPYHKWKEINYIRCIPLALENGEQLYRLEDSASVLMTE